MTMSNGGLNKLMEECGEAIQEAAKISAYPSGVHPDGKGNLFDRLADELADVEAIIEFLRDQHPEIKARRSTMTERARKKYGKFCEWHADPHN